MEWRISIRLSHEIHDVCQINKSFSKLHETMSVNFANQVPLQFNMPQQVTTSKSILRKSLIEILPNQQVEYVPGGNQNRITFSVASNSDFLSGPESYFRMDVVRTDQGATKAQQVSLDVGGVHGMFRSIEVRSSGSGTLLQRMDEYNRYYVIKSLLMDDPDSVQNMGYSFGDSMCIDTNSNVVVLDNGTAFTAVGATENRPACSSYVHPASCALLIDAGYKAGDTITLGLTQAANAEQPLVDANQPLIPAAPIRQSGHVCTILSLQAAQLLVYPPIVANAVFNRASKLQDSHYSSANRVNGRSLLNGTASVTFAFRPLLSMLRHHVPLFLMKGGIEITFELDSHSQFLSSPIYANAAVKITNPRMMAMMVTPQQDVVNEYIRQWRGEGLIYSLPCVKYRSIEDSGAGNEVAHQRHVGVRSARRAYITFQDTVCSRGTRASYNSSLSHFLRDNITKFQMKVGSQEFPNRDIKLSENSLEMLEHLKNVSGSSCFRIKPHEWMTHESNAAYGAAGNLTGPTEKHFIFGVDLSRDNGVDSELCGSDLSVVPLELVFTRDAAHNAAKTIDNVAHAVFPSALVTIGIHVEYDAFFKLSSEQITIIN
jgi:hypothetical protein